MAAGSNSAARPVFEHGQRRVEDARTIAGHAQRAARVVETRRGVRILADAQAEGRQEAGQALSGEVLRALELHVLDKVRQAALVVVFQDRPGLDDQPESTWRAGLGFGRM